MSKYGELAEKLSLDIRNGVYHAGDRLPTTPELCELYNVSNTTVKKAMDELEQRGLVARRRGSGVYVKSVTSLLRHSAVTGNMAGQMAGLTSELATSKMKLESVVNRFGVIHPSEAVAEALGIGEDEFVYDICRTRVVDGVPRNVEYTIMPLSVVPGLVERHLHGSIYGYLEKELGYKIDSAHRVLRAVVPTEEEKEWLKLDPNVPTALFEVRQVCYLDDGTPFEYSIAHHTTEYEFFVVSTL